MKQPGSFVNVKLVIEYDGSRYFGWQRQSNKPTIQQVIEESLQLLLQDKNIKLTGAGRTDTGVHAVGQVANFRVEKTVFRKIGRARFIKSLNAVLPEDISVSRVQVVGDDFHSRYSAKKRQYKYYLCFKKHGFNGNRLHFVKTKFDIDLAKEFCKLVTGSHSFKSLCKNKEDEHDFYCHVFKASVRRRKGGIAEFEIEANRFLHSMVRAVIGAMINTASGKISINEFKQKFNKGEALRIQYVPSKALVLEKIKY